MKEQYKINELIKIVFKNVIVIMIFTIIGGIIAGLYAKHKTTTIYTATTNVFVGRDLTKTNYKNSQVMAELNMIDSYKDMINDPQVLDKAHNNLPKKLRHKYTVSDLEAAINVDSHPQSLVLTIRAKAGTPEDATAIVNATASATHKELPKIIPSAGEFKQLGKASKSDTKSITLPSIKKYVLLGGAIGLLAGMIFSFAITTWKKIL